MVIELDGPAEIAWERGPEPGAESFYLSADPIRSRVIKTKLARVGDIAVTPMRGGTRVLLEPRERRVRAYLLSKPPRLVIDVAPPGGGEFKAPPGVQALAPAIAVVTPHVEPEPEPAPQPRQSRSRRRRRQPRRSQSPRRSRLRRPRPKRSRPPRRPRPRRRPKLRPKPRRAGAGAEQRRAQRPTPPPEPAPPAPETEAVPPEGFPWSLILLVLLGGAGLGALALVVRARGARRIAPATPPPASPARRRTV